MSQETPPQNSPTPSFSVEVMISTILRAGVILSLLVITFGVILMFLNHPGYFSSRTDLAKLTTLNADFPHSLTAIYSGLLHLRGQSFIMLGLGILIGTPVMRVGFSILAFKQQRDRIFVLITLMVFLLLILSFFLGKAE